MNEFDAFADYDNARRASGGICDAIYEGLFPEQQAYINDPARFKAIQCPRRSGKSRVDGADVVMTSEQYPDEDSLCVAITRGHCRATIGQAVERIRRTFDLPLIPKTLDGLLYIHNERTNHRTWMAGCKDFAQADKLRGDYLVKAWVDEAQSIPLTAHPDSMADDTNKEQPKLLLQYLVEDVIAPRLLDRRGTLTLSGTPGALLKGYFWEVTTGDGTRPKWATHSWSMHANVYLPDVEAQIAELCAQFGWDPGSPTYQREILGRWVADPNALVYRYDATKSAWAGGEYPGCIDRAIAEFGNDLHWGMGVDLGHHDATAFVLGFWPRGGQRWGIARVWGGSEMTQPQRAQAIVQTRRDLQARGQHLARVVMDTGGGGKMIAHDLGTTYGLTVEAAQKADKAAGIRLVQADLHSGNLLVNPSECGALLGEWTVLPWDPGHTGHDDRYADHCSDATLYLRRSLPITARFVEPVPTAEDRSRAEAQRIVVAKANAVQLAQLRMQLARARSLSERARIIDRIRRLSGG
jgi:hypothetical protein